MKYQIYTVGECLDLAVKAIKQAASDECDPCGETDVLVFAAARTWIERAEYAARFGNGKIGSGDFADVHESISMDKLV